SDPGTEPFRFVGYEGGEAGAGRRGPIRKLHSFERVEADEVITRRGRHGVIRAPSPFTMLMPAPDTDPGTDLYYVAHARHGGLMGDEAMSDASARAQASATERMLDLLADDDFVKGSSWVSYDGRQLLDLCAAVVGRTNRLPNGHPHRKLAIVGRGESGGEWERRAGQRYRQAMRQAIADGLPVERFQIMRGAPLGWLDSLTADGMYKQVQLREKNHPTAEPVKLRISLRQPHTMSLAVAGDLDLALRTGDTRYVRVALLIEAASVEPIGALARVRVVRAGILSSRPEVLRAARDVLEGLRDEHDHLMEKGELSKILGVRQAMGPDGALWASANPRLLGTLHKALFQVQLRSWGQVLRAELVEPARLRTRQAVGQWLATTMAATGIYDAEALRSIVIRPTGKEWRADPKLLSEFIQRLERGEEALLRGPVERPKLVGPLAKPLPIQPLAAAQITADEFERWAGWKRFVRGVKVVPDTRGKDVDLAFNQDAIRKRMARWFRRARAMATSAPGDVLVVVAGDGLDPNREGAAAELLRAHRNLLRDANVHYLRIQHAQATHLSWYKDFLHTLQERPSGHSVAVQWEAEHGATVNVVMLARRDRSDASGVRAWSLEGWQVEACGVVLADLGGQGGRDYQVGMFTESGRRHVGLSQELVHFGRAHCGGLLKQAGWRVRDSRGAPAPWELERGIVRQIARWIERTRGFFIDESVDEEAASGLVAQRLGLVDPRLARALARERQRDEPPERAAEALWASVPAWPGVEFDETVVPIEAGTSW
ncbi:MAG: hypothetical protein GWP91_24360, partial [Rhodobacterales bacterium]|nr:hypothetical protein [Rhodobacterales bacterium]